MPGRDDLYPFQREGVAALVSRPALLLADEMGTGKTVQAIGGLTLLAEHGELGRALVVAPTGLLAQWRTALDEWAPGLAAIRVDGPAADRAWKWGADRRVFLASYETVRNDIGAARRRPWDVVVLDEAQRIKNRDTAVSQVLKLLPRRRAWALTGTPLENREDDLASILEFVRANPEGNRLAPLRTGPFLRGVQSELQLRRRKVDVLTDLPPKTVARIPLELTAEQRRAYVAIEDAGREEVRRLGATASVVNVLEVIGRLKQACNFCPDSGSSAKLDDLNARADEIVASGQRALVFSQWTNDRFGVGRLAHELRRLAPLTYSGALSAGERDRRVTTFKADRRHGVMVLSLRAGGQGLNLQEASYVVHFDRWWNPAIENQASDRVHRPGQQNPVTVYTYTCLDTIEERIEKILDGKRQLFDTLVDRISLDLSGTLTPDELFGLLGLRAPTRLHRDDPTPAEGVAARTRDRLERAGWTVRRRPAASVSVVDMKGRRAGDEGDVEELWLTCREGPIPASVSDVAAIASAVASREGVLGGVACLSATDDTRRAADAAGVRLWVIDSPAADRPAR